MMREDRLEVLENLYNKSIADMKQLQRQLEQSQLRVIELTNGMKRMEKVFNSVFAREDT